MSVAIKGALDLKAHVETPKHLKSVRGTSYTKVTNFLATLRSKSDESVTVLFLGTVSDSNVMCTEVLEY